LCRRLSPGRRRRGKLLFHNPDDDGFKLDQTGQGTIRLRRKLHRQNIRAKNEPLAIDIRNWFAVKAEGKPLSEGMERLYVLSLKEFNVLSNSAGAGIHLPSCLICLRRMTRACRGILRSWNGALAAFRPNGL
jgi:hypothetical protein